MIVEIKGSIVDVNADVIINSANTHLNHSDGVAASIAIAAGSELIEECNKIGFVPIGEYAISGPGKLLAKQVFHVPTIDYSGAGKVITLNEVEGVFREILGYCFRHGIESLATPLIGAGSAGLNPVEVESTLRRVAEEFPQLEIKIVKL